MKRYCALAAVLALAASTHATEYVLHDPSSWRLATRFDLLAAEIVGEEVLLAGVSAGAWIGPNVLAMLSGAMVCEDVESSAGTVECGDCWQMGGRLEWVVRRAEIYNVGFHLLLAAQRLSLGRQDERERDTALLLQPGIDAAINLWPGAELGATLGFRWLDKIAVGGLDEGDCDGVAGGVFLRFTQTGR